MIFTDPVLLFAVVPLLLGAFHLARRVGGVTAALFVLLVGSLLIYAPFGLTDLTIVGVSLVVNFAVATALTSSDAPRRRSLLFWSGQGYNLLSLLWFKYAVFQGVYRLVTTGTTDHGAALIPIGISFYTFQQAIVLTDVYQREPAALAFMGAPRTLRQRGAALIRYSFFVTFFPHMLIGPIAYLREIQPQLAARTFGVLRQRDLFVGLFLVSIGLVKKLAIADNLGPAADAVFAQAAAGADINGQSAWLGAVSYYFQLYFDFSGYADMALGFARLFGLIFPINFYSPLKAVGIVDYYRRWHMTLTRAIARFLFTPLALGGTRLAMQPRLSASWTSLLGLWLPLLLNFIVIGLWHGGLWTFVLFGAVHGSWYVFEVEFRKTRWWKAHRRRTSDRVRRVIGRALFFVPMVLSLAIFRSDSVAAFGHLLNALIVFDPTPLKVVPSRGSLLWIAVAAFVVYSLPNAVELLSRYRPGIMTYKNESYGIPVHARPNVAWTFGWVTITLVALYFIARQPPFLYMGF